MYSSPVYSSVRRTWPPIDSYNRFIPKVVFMISNFLVKNNQDSRLSYSVFHKNKLTSRNVGLYQAIYPLRNRATISKIRIYKAIQISKTPHAQLPLDSRPSNGSSNYQRRLTPIWRKTSFFFSCHKFSEKGYSQKLPAQNLFYSITRYCGTTLKSQTK